MKGFSNWRELSLGLMLALVLFFFALCAPQFLTARNLSMLIIEFSITSVLSLGMLLIILPGHVDLAAGSGVGLIGGIAAVLVTRGHLPAGLALLLALAAALGLWRAMGMLIVLPGIPAFIVTLGGLLVYKGLFLLIIANTTVPVSSGGVTNLYSALTTYYLPPRHSFFLAAGVILLLAYAKLRRYHAHRLHSSLHVDGEILFLTWLVCSQAIFALVLLCAEFRGLPLSALLLAGMALLVHTLTRHTRFGRYLYAIGGNEEAAILSGIPVRKVVLGAFTLMGGVVALTGFLQTAYAGASTTTVGELMELDAVAACVIGGASLRGGRGSVPGVLLGGFIMAALLNGLSLLAVPPEARYIARGAVLGLAAFMDVAISRGRRS